MKPLSKWARRWVYIAFQVAVSVAAWLFLVTLIASLVLMVLIVGLLAARGVLPLARFLAGRSLAAAQGLRRLGETGSIRPVPPGGGGLAVVVTALLRSGQTWLAATYCLFSAVSLPVNLLFLVLLPVTGQWARLHAALTVWWLARPDRARRSSKAAPQLPLSASGRAAGGFGLIGMRERVAALGGDFQAGPTADGGFEVTALFPLEDPLARQAPAAPPTDSDPTDEEAAP
ncbi:MAG: sensor domain-containing protein [Bifidobacteriaceae bacterium]|jgi:hypothetical protein|nr:sensor domain-containing protein [Bifidobacteriaceae bacterium]